MGPHGNGRLSAPFITLEGGEGVGKSTQANMLLRRIRGAGVKAILTREPGGTGLGKSLRDLITVGEAMDAKTELLLFVADRAHHISQTIEPALRRGELVLCDRFVDSSEVYQGRVRGLGHERVRQLHRWICGEVWPELTILLDLDPASGLGRAAQRQGDLGLDRIESQNMDFHLAVRRGFLEQAEEEHGRIKVVDASGPPEDVADRIWGLVEPVIAGWRSHAS